MLFLIAPDRGLRIFVIAFLRLDSDGAFSGRIDDIISHYGKAEYLIVVERSKINCLRFITDFVCKASGAFLEDILDKPVLHEAASRTRLGPRHGREHRGVCPLDAPCPTRAVDQSAHGDGICPGEARATCDLPAERR